MFKINDDYSILLAQGDTMKFAITLTIGDEETPASYPEDTVAVFAINRPVTRTVATRTAVPLAAGLRAARISEPIEYVTALRKNFPVQDGNVIIVALTNAETRALEIGDYRWDVRIVTDPEYDDQGDVKCDDTSDEVLSIFSGGLPMPKFTVTEAIVIV